MQIHYQEQIAADGPRVALVQAHWWAAPYLALLRADGTVDLRVSSGLYADECDGDPVGRGIVLVRAYGARWRERQGINAAK